MFVQKIVRRYFTFGLCLLLLLAGCEEPIPTLEPVTITSPPWTQLPSRNATGSISNASASRSTDCSTLQWISGMPKPRMALPMGWENYFGFVCTPSHHTYVNVRRDGEFTVSYPRPEQLVLTSLAASPRCDDEAKPALDALPVFAASRVAGVGVAGCAAFLECELERIIDGFGRNSLIVGRVVAACVARDRLRLREGDDAARAGGNGQLPFQAVRRDRHVT